MLLEKLKGKFITFEGVEGSGKSTQAHKLKEYLESNGIETILTREPGGSTGGEEIRKLLVNGSINKWDGITELLLMYASRRDHTEKLIKPALKENKCVISDRYFDSSTAYQGYGYQLDINKINTIKTITLENFEPDITFIFDIPVEEGLERTNIRGQKNRYEDMEISFHNRVRKGFQDIAKENTNRVKLIDIKNLSIEEVHNKIILLLKSHFKF